MHPNNLSVSPQAPVPLDHDAYLHVHYPAVDPSVPIPLCDEVDVTQRGGLQIPEEEEHETLSSELSLRPA